MNSLIKTELQNLLNEGDEEKTILYIEEQLKKFPNDEELIFNIGIFLIFTDNHIFSYEIIDNYTQSNEYSTEILLLKSYLEIYNTSRLEPLTLDKVENLIRDNSINETTIHFFQLLGFHYDFTDNKEKGMYYYQKSIEHDPTATSNYWSLGLCLVSSKYIKQSIDNMKVKIGESKSDDPFSFEYFINNDIRGVLGGEYYIQDRQKMYHKIKRRELFLKIKKWLGLN